MLGLPCGFRDGLDLVIDFCFWIVACTIRGFYILGFWLFDSLVVLLFEFDNGVDGWLLVGLNALVFITCGKFGVICIFVIS